MSAPRSALSVRPVRPELQGPGVLRKRYVRRPEGGATPGATLPAAAPQPAAPATGFLGSGRVVIFFIALLITCQLALLVGALSPLRVLFRITAFGTSLALLVMVPGQGRRHPARGFLMAAVAIASLNFFHPSTNSPMAAAVQLGIQLSVLAPIFWATRLVIDERMFRRIVVLLFLFNMASATVGVLQVYFPGRFQPALSSIVESQGEGYLRSLQFETTSGERVFRPMGLTDLPGGAATGAFYSVLLGGGLLLSGRKSPWQVLAVAGIGVGLVSLYLCQVRAAAVTLAVCMVAMGVVLALSGRLVRMVALASVVGTLAVLAFGWALTMGGDAVLSRWNTLFDSTPGNVYQSNRGHFLESTFGEALPEYPLGAGLGRYGMANAYFGDNRDPEHPPLWAEIQWTAWVYDGGALGILFYPLALLVTMAWGFQVARRRDDLLGEFWLWGSLLFAYDLGALALTFSYPFFMSQSGMEFWLLNAALYSAYHHATLHPHRR
ncbi:hypothetical protein KRR26_12035 [Corallococcus sp. M34]|uniref:O-antigen ligase family protein n=1 Tax=Citreicoccus inhibens TaxID=2849499 RepID=UPI001C22AB6C|nr:hypothetical protein [Citreicoccus inhibens]MBU8896341.1 hypothetical protein [Citreicoccus inhibens]